MQRRDPGELPDLLTGPGIVRVDVPVRDDESADLLTKHFDLHPRAAVDCANRNPLPKVHDYPEHDLLLAGKRVPGGRAGRSIGPCR